MQVLVPFTTRNPKTRLAPVLDDPERLAFATAMLADVLDAVAAAGGEPTVLATEPLDAVDDPGAATVVADESLPTDPAATVATRDVDVRVDDRPLTDAVNVALTDRLEGESPTDAVAVVVADLPLATPSVLRGLFGATGDVVVAPGRGGGTSALVIREPAFRVDYHGASCLDHLRHARDVGASVREFDSRRLATDVDEPGDLSEVLLHADGAAADWLRTAGVALDVGDDGRVGVDRDGERF